jgi:hypothetical protein
VNSVISLLSDSAIEKTIGFEIWKKIKRVSHQIKKPVTTTVFMKALKNLSYRHWTLHAFMAARPVSQKM